MALPAPATPVTSPGPMASGVSAPSPSLGAEAAAVSKIRGAIQILQQAAVHLDAASEFGKTVYECIKKLAEKAPSSQSTSGAETTAIQNSQQDAQKKAMLMAILQKAGQNGGNDAPAGPSPAANEGE